MLLSHSFNMMIIMYVVDDYYYYDNVSCTLFFSYIHCTILCESVSEILNMSFLCVGITWTHVTITCGCTNDTCHLRWCMYHYFYYYYHIIIIILKMSYSLSHMTNKDDSNYHGKRDGWWKVNRLKWQTSPPISLGVT